MRVVIAEDSVLLQEGIVRLLEEEDCVVVAAVGDGDALLKAVEAHRPEVCVVDVRMPPTFTDEGLRAARDPRGGIRTSVCSCCRSTSRSGTRAS